MTHWTVVLAAGSDARALEDLCRTYWYPLYAYLRRRRYRPEDAQDLVQEFLTGLIERKGFGGVSPEKGRFRSFLLAALTNFLTDEARKRTAQKRGSGQALVSMDEREAEAWYAREPADHQTPEVFFEQKCAHALMDRALKRLEREWVGRSESRRKQFPALLPLLTRIDRDDQYQEAGRRLGMTAGAVTSAVSRLRGHLGKLLRAEVAATVEDSAELEVEVRHVLRAAGRAGLG